MIEVVKEIKFSHRYYKMPPNVEKFETVLLEAFRVNLSELSNSFLLYDTKYPGGEYPLKGREMIVLLLMTGQVGMDVCWTTIRSFNPEKWRYYLGLRGKPVRIVVE